MNKERFLDEIYHMKKDFDVEYNDFNRVLEPNFYKPYSWRYQEEQMLRNSKSIFEEIGEEFFSFVKKELNSVMHNYRIRKYQEMKSLGKMRMVAEGDSWFQHPLLDDIIDHMLQDEYAVLCYSAAGDQLLDMSLQAEFLDAVEYENPVCFLLSGGGNDLLMPSEFRPLLAQKKSSFIDLETLETKLAVLRQSIESIIYEINQKQPGLPVFMHGYDYIVPRPDARYKWVYPILMEQGIYQAQDQQKIIYVIIDQFNDLLQKIAHESNGQFFHVDLRGTLNDVSDWYDEIHPTESGYRKITDVFMQKMQQLIQ